MSTADPSEAPNPQAPLGAGAIASTAGRGEQPTAPSPRSGTNSAPISHERAVPALAFRHHPRLVHGRFSPTTGQRQQRNQHHLVSASLSPPLLSSSAPNNSSPLQQLSLSPSIASSSAAAGPTASLPSPSISSSSRPRRVRSVSLGRALSLGSGGVGGTQRPLFTASLSPRYSQKKLLHPVEANQQTQLALQQNDAMVYLEGPCVYACQQCRTHLTSHDDVISKSFHGRHGRAFLLNSAVNVRVGPSEDRMLMTGLHSVCDIFCQRCNTLIGWTYQKAYEASQKYKEGKYIIEKINLYLEDPDLAVAGDDDGDVVSRHYKERRRRGFRRAGETDVPHEAAATGLCPRIATDVYEYYPITESATTTRGQSSASPTVVDDSVGTANSGASS